MIKFPKLWSRITEL